MIKVIFKTIFIMSLFFNQITLAHEGKKNINTEKSTIEWHGKSLSGAHEGLVNFTSGFLNMDHGRITGGSFVVDMRSLHATDLKGEWLDKLNGHLKNDDFFGVDKHPTSKLVFKTVKKIDNHSYNITADLTIKGHTEEVSFVLRTEEGGANVNLRINRTKYGIKYGSGTFFDNLGDKTIDDYFTIKVHLVY